MAGATMAPTTSVEKMGEIASIIHRWESAEREGDMLLHKQARASLQRKEQVTHVTIQLFR